MDTFGGYDGILNSVNQRAVSSNQHLDAKSNIIQRNDEIMKTLGEAKTFLSGKSIGSKVSQALKEKATRTAEKYASQAKEGIQNQINQKISQGGSRLENLRGRPMNQPAGRGDESGDMGEELQDANSWSRGVSDNAIQDAADLHGIPNLQPETSFDEVGETRVEGQNLQKYIDRKAEEKAGEKAGGDIGEEESGAGILDAIPGLDIIGLIGGAVMAGVAGHKAHVQGKEVAKKMMNTGVSVGSTFQSGI